MNSFRSLHWLLSFALLLTCMFAIPSLAQKDKQKKDQAADVLHIATDEVLMDVIVTDKTGKLVRDLRREDFEILDAGQPQKISGFAVNVVGATKTITEKGTITGAGIRATEMPLGRYIILAIDDLHIHPGNAIQTRDAVLRFIDEQLGENDQVALYMVSGQLGMFQQFTDDRAVLRRAVARMGVIEMPQMWYEPTLRKTFLPLEAEMHANNQTELLAVLSNAPVGTGEAYQLPANTNQQTQGSAAASLEAQANSNVLRASRYIAEQNRIVTMRTFASLLEALRNLRALPERKIMVLFSEGFLMGGGFTGTPITDLSTLTDAATRSEVKIYAIDVRGVPMDATSLERRNTEAIRFPLEHLANNTGGKVFLDNNDINWSLSRVMEDTEAYYRLSFEPLIAIRDGRFHDVKVRIPLRPELTVRTSKGYLAPPSKTLSETTSPPRVSKTLEQIAAEIKAAQAKQLNDSLAALYPLRGIPLDLQTQANDSNEVLLTLLIDATKLKYDQVGDRYRTTLELACNIYDEKGKLATNFSEFLSLNPKAETLYKAVKGGAFRYRRAVTLKPGFYQVRVAMREDKETRTGSAAEWIEVPDFSKPHITLGDVRFKLPTLKPETKVQIDQEGKLDQVDEAQRTLLRQRFRAASVPEAEMKIYQPSSGDAHEFNVQAQIVSRGKTVMRLPSNAIKVGEMIGAGQVYNFALASLLLAPGRYELQVNVEDRTARKTVQQNKLFFVE